MYGKGNLAVGFLREEHKGITKTIIPYVRKFTEITDDMYYHDIIPAMMLFESGFLSVKRGNVNVDLQNEVGKTVFSENTNGNACLACDFDSDKFFTLYDAVVKRTVKEESL